VASVLGRSVADDAPLMAAGLDSLGAVELRNALESRLGGAGGALTLPPTMIFDYPTTAALAGFISSQVGAADQIADVASTASAAAGAPPPRALREGSAAAAQTLIALTGTASRSPGGALQQATATDAICAVPFGRWDWEQLGGSFSAAAAADATASADADPPARFGGWLDGIELFDVALFGISSAEAELMDAQQRLLLELAHEAIWVAGGSGGDGSVTALGADACVAVGIASAEYNNWVLRRAGQPPSAYSATGGALSVASGRLAFVYGLHGAAVSVDTACSSSLVAAHFAVGQIGGGVSSGGLVAGAGLILSPEPTAMFAKAGMLAPDGRCKTLDAAADGYVRAEAVGVMVLQRQQAVGSASSSPPLALLAGSAVNQDGRSSGLTAPNGPAQQEVIRAALAAAGVGAGQMSRVEMHGTGTGLGDPIEVGALAAALSSKSSSSSTRRQQPLLLTAGKSWIGHSEAAAGVMGLLHAARSLQTMQAQAVLHLATTNPYLDAALRMPLSFDGAAGSSWSLPRQAAGVPFVDQGAVHGVSSFAFQGTNGHILLRAPPPAAPSAAPAAPSDAAVLVWQRTHTWAAPTAWLLIHRALPDLYGTGGGLITLQCHLDGAVAGFFFDNQIAGCAWLPTSAVLEVAAEAAALGGGGGAACTLTALVLPSGLPLGHGEPDVVCTLHAATGLLEVQAAASGGDGSMHQPRRHALLFATVGTPAPDSHPAAPPRPTATAALTSPAARLARTLFAAEMHAGAAAFAAVDVGSAAVPAPGGLLMHPCAMEAALQLEGIKMVAGLEGLEADGGDGRLDTAAVAGLIKVPASMGACQISGGFDSKQQTYHAHAAQPHASSTLGGRQLTSMWLHAGSGSGDASAAAAPCCCVADAEFRALVGSGMESFWGPAAAANHAATAADAAGGSAAAAWTTDLEIWEIEEVVSAAVESILGQPVAADEPLMAAGLDSLGAVELRAALRERLGGLLLPSTLLYDHQSVSAIAAFIAEDLAVPQPAGGVGAGSGSGGGNGGGVTGARPATARSLAAQVGPSSLLKLLRGVPAPRPLFLAAPGVANAQSAYVSCLLWGFGEEKVAGWSGLEQQQLAFCTPP